MLKNVGWIDRGFRFFWAVFLIWFGLFFLEGIHGNILGILVSVTALLPLYMVITQSCFVFRWFNIHSLSKKEILRFGDSESTGKN
ncbi:MAG: DUF2892 domain-containing protein [Candidatus Marinimicrobia bacterium]|nr:DUF2892 domain-containing protein [Candidatus Neomarinimicrobiota bacterium]